VPKNVRDVGNDGLMNRYCGLIAAPGFEINVATVFVVSGLAIFATPSETFPAAVPLILDKVELGKS